MLWPVFFGENLHSNKYAGYSLSRPDWIEITDAMPFAAEKRQILAIWRKLGYSMTSLDTRVKRAFGVPYFVWLRNGEQVSTLLSDLQRREKAFDKKRREGRVGEERG